MMNSISPLGSTVLTIVKPLGKPITLVVGDIIDAEIIDVLETGGVTLKIEGSFLTAKSEVPLQKDSSALFKVLTDESGTQLKLQFLGYSGKVLNQQAALNHQNSLVEKTLRDLSAILLKEGVGTKSFPETFDKIFTELTAEFRSASKEFEIQVGQMLRESLGSSGFFHAFLPSGWRELKDGDISFRKTRRDKKDSYSCRIDLDLAKHGKLSIVLLMINKEFFVYFRVADDRLKEIMNSHLAELKEGFAGMGSNLRVTFLDKNTSAEEMERTASLERIVDVKA